MPGPAEASASAGVLVVDARGEVFDLLRQLDLPVALWRVLDPHRIAQSLAIDLTVCAAYAAIDWNMVAQLSPYAPTLLITTTYQRSEAEEALRRDLIGYLDARIAQPALDRALRGALLQGELAFPRDLIGAWMRERRESADADNQHADGLTGRQREILALIAQGATDKQIAATLGIAQTTAQKHVTNILRRLDVPNRAAAVAAMPRVAPTRGEATARGSRHDVDSGGAERVTGRGHIGTAPASATSLRPDEHKDRRAS